jgi:putative DNA primase/helicase
VIAIDDLPADIRKSPRAVLWNREERDGKPTKVPYQVRQPARKAAVNNPATWAPFVEEVDAYHDGKSDGAGIVLGDKLSTREEDVAKPDADFAQMLKEIGGRQEARTPDLRVANAALSQLS